MQKTDWPLKPDFDYKKPVLNEELDCHFIGNLKKDLQNHSLFLLLIMRASPRLLFLRTVF